MASPHRLRAPAAHGEVLAVPDFHAVKQQVELNRQQLDHDHVIIDGLTLRELRALARREVLNLARREREHTANREHEHNMSRERQRPEQFQTPVADAPGSTPHAPGSTPHTPGSTPHTPGSTPHTPSFDVPLLLAGHQPELSHPGVWVKNFALNGIARQLGGQALNLIVDNDTLKTSSLWLPVFTAGDAASVRRVAVPFDRFDSRTPYELRPVHDESLFASVPERAAALCRNWGYEPLLATHWPSCGGTIGERFTALRCDRERAWGCDHLELRVSQLARTEAFQRFAAHLQADEARFRAVYNAAIRAYRAANGIRSVNHPAPELSPGESPFWQIDSTGRRDRATHASRTELLRPRALTLTLFARVCLGDYFIHGIGGGKYDEATDLIIRDYFGLEPPAYMVLSATLLLPLPGFTANADEVRRLERIERDIQWNPERHLDHPPSGDPRWRRLIADRSDLIARGPIGSSRESRRDWFEELRFVVERLRPYAEESAQRVQQQLAQARDEARANAILRRRDYSWVLFPEDMLRPFLQRFLTPAM